MIVNDLPGSGNDMSVTLGYNPAGQIRQYGRDADAYAWTGSKPVSRDYAANGLNQYVGTSTGGEFAYDANGNLISTRNAPWSTDYVYDVENRLVSASGTHNAFLVYDPLGRLSWFSGPNTGMTQLLYDGDALVAEYDGAGTLTKRYVHGPGTDDPVAVYEGPALGLAARKYMLPDERGSIAALVNANGTPAAINSYDEYGIPGTNNQGRFQYTGQAWIAELGLYHYKARFYSPFLGRFLQTDPIGYQGGVNLYASVKNDPINLNDPTGNNPAAICLVPGPSTLCGALAAKTVEVIAVIGCALFCDNVIDSVANRHESNEDEDSDRSVEDKRRGSAPSDAPRGTRAIDSSGIDRQGVHDIKDGIGAGPKDYVGITPQGNIVTTDPKTGHAVDQGHISDHDVEIGRQTDKKRRE
jgi:RHS repeat-associated protein